MAMPDFASLTTLLDDECDLLEAFVLALSEEQHTLARSADVAALPAIVERKAALYERLNALGQARSAWLAKHQFAGISDVFVVHPTLGEQWTRIIDLAKMARRSNETNGRLMRTRMSYNRAALDSIRAAHGTTPNVYGSDGRI